jgi:hypothetical protein
MVRQPKPDAVKKIDRDRTRQKNYDAMMKKSKINKEESEKMFLESRKKLQDWEERQA